MRDLRIRTYPDPCLRVRVKAVEKFDNELEELVRAMAEIMYNNNGIGLAATQVGLDDDLAVIDAGDGLMALVNPKIIAKSRKKDKMEEGCLSLPGINVKVARHERIEIKAQDIKGNVFQGKYDGLMAKVIQHELDHLHGKLLIDYMNPVVTFFAARKITRVKKAKKS